MTLYNMPNLTSGPDTFLVGIQTQVTSFVPMLLVFVYLIILIGGSVSQKRRTGFTDLPMWSTLASISTLMIALSLTMISGLINLGWLSVVVAVTIFSGAWLFLSRNKNEV